MVINEWLGVVALLLLASRRCCQINHDRQGTHDRIDFWWLPRNVVIVTNDWPDTRLDAVTISPIGHNEHNEHNGNS